eukprot:m.170973 g.170973  ORF g.170973 m.170973 type:complete len:96 (+) comp16493_c0_seq1:177-464(+)
MLGLLLVVLSLFLELVVLLLFLFFVLLLLLFFGLSFVVESFVSLQNAYSIFPPGWNHQSFLVTRVFGMLLCACFWLILGLWQQFSSKHQLWLPAR